MSVEQNLFQQTYACTAPLLSDTGMYPTVRGALLVRACVAIPRPTSPKYDGRSVHDALCTVQFVRAISPSTSYAPAAVALAKNYGWKRVCTLAFKSPDYTATTVAWTKSMVDNSITIRNLYLDEQGFRRAGSPSATLSKTGSLSATLSKIDTDRLRVIIVFAPAEFVKLAALRADAMGFVSSGWAWVSDGVIGKIDFKGDTPDVRARRRVVFPRVPALSQTCLRPEQLASTRLCHARFRMLGAIGCCDASQAIATRRAFNGWLYLAPLDPETPGVRHFKNDVRKLTQPEFGFTLAEDEPIDAAAAKLYDGIFLWAKALSRVFSSNGAPLHGLTG